MTAALTKALKVLGTVLVLGGLGHTLGVAHLYVTAGLPETNRIMLDLYVAEAQLLAGALYIAASRGERSVVAARALAVFGAVTTLGFAVPILPLLFSRAPVSFIAAPIVYILASAYILVDLARSKRELDEKTFWGPSKT
jgi:hypothetical protein